MPVRELLRINRDATGLRRSSPRTRPPRTSPARQRPASRCMSSNQEPTWPVCTGRCRTASDAAPGLTCGNRTIADAIRRIRRAWHAEGQRVRITSAPRNFSYARSKKSQTLNSRPWPDLGKRWASSVGLHAAGRGSATAELSQCSGPCLLIRDEPGDPLQVGARLAVFGCLTGDMESSACFRLARRQQSRRAAIRQIPYRTARRPAVYLIRNSGTRERPEGGWRCR